MPMFALPVVVGVKSAMTTTSAAIGAVITPTPAPRATADRVATPPPTGIVALPLGTLLESIPMPDRSGGRAARRAKESAWSWLPSFTPQPPPLFAAGTMPVLRKAQGPSAGDAVLAIAAVPPLPLPFWLRAMTATISPTARTVAATPTISTSLPRRSLSIARPGTGGLTARLGAEAGVAGRTVGSARVATGGLASIPAAAWGTIRDRSAPGSREWGQFGPQRRVAIAERSRSNSAPVW